MNVVERTAGAGWKGDLMKNRKELIERLQTLLTNTRDEARRSGGHFDSGSYDRGYHSGRAEMADSVLLWLGGILDAVGNFEGGVSGGSQAPKTASVIISSKFPQDPFGAGPAPEYTITVGQDAAINTPTDIIYITWKD